MDAVTAGTLLGLFGNDSSDPVIVLPTTSGEKQTIGITYKTRQSIRETEKV